MYFPLSLKMFDKVDISTNSGKYLIQTSGSHYLLGSDYQIATIVSTLKQFKRIKLMVRMDRIGTYSNNLVEK